MMPNRLSSAILLACLLPSTALAVGGFDVTQVAPGIYTGPSPESASDYQCLQQLGIRTVIDSQAFRPLASRREQHEVERRGMRYLHIPIDFRPTDDRSPHHVLYQLAAACNQPVYLHCHLGRDRTGLVVALYRVQYLGWDPAAAYAAMEGMQFNPMLRDMDRYFWRYAPMAAAGAL